MIRDDGCVATVHPLRAELLEELLIERWTFRPDGHGGVRADSVPEHFFSLDDRGGLAFLAGLVARVAASLRRAGYQVEIQDRGIPPISNVEPDVVNVTSYEQRAFVVALAGNRRGVIEVRSDRDRFEVIELVLRVFAQYPVAIVTKTRREARKLSRHLTATLKEPVDCCTRGLTGSDIRVRVGTIGSLDLTLASVVLFTDASQVLHKDVQRLLQMLRDQRVYGLLDDRLALSRRERLVIEGSVGPVISRHGQSGDRPVEVRAVFASWTGKDLPDEPLGLKWKRQSIWSNEERNSALSRIAGALTNGNVATLWEFGLFVDDMAVLQEGQKRRVVVLVESVEHANQLARYLPEWPVLRADGSGSEKAVRLVEIGSTTERNQGLPDRAIMTLAAVQRRGRIEADVLVRADGTPWPLDLPFAAGRPEQLGARPVLLVDLADDHDRTARDATRARMLAYQARDWVREKRDSGSIEDQLANLRIPYVSPMEIADSGHYVQEPPTRNMTPTMSHARMESSLRSTP
jgi:hypothetical protein